MDAALTHPNSSLPSRIILPDQAAEQLDFGRRVLEKNGLEAALPYFKAAMEFDPAIACERWGILPNLEAQNRGIFRDRMVARMQHWYGSPQSAAHAPVAGLSNKMRMRKWIANVGLPLPAQIDHADRVQDLAWDNIQAPVVIKPVNGASNLGVVIAIEGQDVMAQTSYGPNLRNYVCDLYGQEFETPPEVIAETLLQDVDAITDPKLMIPRDFKVFAIAGHAVFVRVHDRNTTNGKRSMATFDRQGRPCPAALQSWPEAPSGPAPAGFDQIIVMAETLSRALPWLMRFDFFLTPQGPVFGEFTSFPNAGLDLTPFGRRTLLQMWEIWPD
jgi:hypothetical protein